MNKKICWIVCFLLFAAVSVTGRQADSSKVVSGKDSLRIIPEPFYRNVIKLNPTPMMLWDNRNVTLSYERILNNNKQSFTVGLGYLVFGNLFSDTIASVITNDPVSKNGVNFSLEYRFYLTRRNARPIPDGLFIAPFYSLY